MHLLFLSIRTGKLHQSWEGGVCVCVCVCVCGGGGGMKHFKYFHFCLSFSKDIGAQNVNLISTRYHFRELLLLDLCYIWACFENDNWTPIDSTEFFCLQCSLTKVKILVKSALHLVVSPSDSFLVFSQSFGTL